MSTSESRMSRLLSARAMRPALMMSPTPRPSHKRAAGIEVIHGLLVLIENHRVAEVSGINPEVHRLQFRGVVTHCVVQSVQGIDVEPDATSFQQQSGLDGRRHSVEDLLKGLLTAGRASCLPGPSVVHCWPLPHRKHRHQELRRSRRRATSREGRTMSPRTGRSVNRSFLSFMENPSGM